MPTESRGAAAWEGGVEVESDAASAEPGSGRCSPVSRRASDFSASISGKLAASEVLDVLRGAGCSAASVSHRVADDPGISPFALLLDDRGPQITIEFPNSYLPALRHRARTIESAVRNQF
jgi:hypothetical protein